MSEHTDIVCKKCGLSKVVKSGVVRERQRFRCKECGCNFRIGDNRTDEKIAAKKALCILWYATVKGSYRMIGHSLNVEHSLVCRWVRDFGQSLPEPKIPKDIKGIKFDEVWQFMGLKEESSEFLKQLIGVHKKRLPISLVDATQQRLDDSTEKFNT